MIDETKIKVASLLDEGGNAGVVSSEWDNPLDEIG
jgi:hypothetical protein